MLCESSYSTEFTTRFGRGLVPFWIFFVSIPILRSYWGSRHVWLITIKWKSSLSTFFSCLRSARLILGVLKSQLWIIITATRYFTFWFRGIQSIFFWPWWLEAMWTFSTTIIVNNIISQIWIVINEPLNSLDIGVSDFHWTSLLERWFLIWFNSEGFRSLSWIIEIVVKIDIDIISGSRFKSTFVYLSFRLSCRSWFNRISFFKNYRLWLLHYSFSRLWWAVFTDLTHFYMILIQIVRFSWTVVSQWRYFNPTWWFCF